MSPSSGFSFISPFHVLVISSEDAAKCSMARSNLLAVDDGNGLYQTFVLLIVQTIERFGKGMYPSCFLVIGMVKRYVQEQNGIQQISERWWERPSSVLVL